MLFLVVVEAQTKSLITPNGGVSFLQLIYIACSYATVYLIYMKFKATYDGNHDTFRVEFLVVPVGGLSFLVNHDFSPLEVGFLLIPKRTWVASK